MNQSHLNLAKLMDGVSLHGMRRLTNSIQKFVDFVQRLNRPLMNVDARHKRVIRALILLNHQFLLERMRKEVNVSIAAHF
jgi:hypothetical protein